MHRPCYLILMIIIMVLSTGCGQSASELIRNVDDIDAIEIRGVSEEDPSSELELRPITQKAKVNEIVELVSAIKVRKLSLNEKNEMLKNNEILRQPGNYTIIFKSDKEKDEKSASGILVILDDGTLIITDPKTINGSKTGVSYIPLKDQGEVGKILLETVKSHILSETCVKEMDYNELQTKYLKQEKDYYKSFIDKTLQYLDDEELLELAESEWKYNLEVNEKKVTKDGNIRVSDSDIVISFVEEQTAFTALPHEISSMGRIENWTTHFSVQGPEPFEKRDTNGTVVHGVHYEYRKLAKGNTIRIKLSDALKKRLGLETNEIQIMVE